MVGRCYKIVPFNVRTGTNVVPELARQYTWYDGPTVKELIMEDQLRTNFDPVAYERLVAEPFKLQITTRYLIEGLGVGLEGRVMSTSRNISFLGSLSVERSTLF